MVSEGLRRASLGLGGERQGNNEERTEAKKTHVDSRSKFASEGRRAADVIANIRLPEGRTQVPWSRFPNPERSTWEGGADLRQEARR